MSKQEIDFELVRAELVRRIRAGEDPTIEEVVEWVLESSRTKSPVPRQPQLPSAQSQPPRAQPRNLTSSASTNSIAGVHDIELEGESSADFVPVVSPLPVAERIKKEFSAEHALHNAFEKSPWWLLSLALHLLILVILAMIIIFRAPRESELVYRVAIVEELAPTPEPGVQIEEPTPSEELVDEHPKEIEDVEVAPAEVEPHEVTREPEPEAPEVPDLVAENSPAAPSPAAAELASLRSAEHHLEAIGKYGGSQASEEAVRMGLEWLAAHQDLEGGWDGKEFGKHCDDLTCWGPGYADISEGLTGISLLAFLGAGHTHMHTSRFQDTVARGLLYLRRLQGDDGCFGPKQGESGYLYEHAIATLVLAEAFALTGDERLRAPVQSAIDFLAAAQQKGGGWDYTEYPTGRNDVSITGWVIMALKSARLSKLEVPETVWKRARDFLRHSTKASGDVVYANKEPATGRTGIGMTAVGLLCRLYLGESPSRPILRKMAERIADDPPNYDQLFLNQFHTMYYWYYGTLALFQVGGERWQRWNSVMRDTLVDRQIRAGHAGGSWDPEDPWLGTHGGRIYSTALCVLNLEVYYRYLPIYASDKVEGGVDGAVDDASESSDVESQDDASDDTSDNASDDASSGPTVKEAVKLSDSTSTQDRARGVRALVESDGSDAAIDGLLAYLDDPAATIRWQAAKGLGQFASTRAVAPLIKRLPGEEAFMKKQIYDTLGLIGDEAALPALAAELERNDRTLNPRIMMALAAITGEDFGTDRKRWLAWLDARGGKR